MSYRKSHIQPKLKNLRKKTPFFQRPLLWVSLLFILIIGGFVYCSWFAPQFEISEIKTAGNVKVSSGQINEVLASYTNRLILLDADAVSNDMIARFPVLDSVEVKKEVPHTISITVHERTGVAAFCQMSTNCFLIDQKGVIFESVPDVPENLVKIVRDEEPVTLGQHILTEKIVSAILEIANNLKGNFDIAIAEALATNPLVVQTTENWKIYFNLNSDIDAQIKKMNALLSDEITESQRKNLHYIYLQFKDRAYYQ